MNPNPGRLLKRGAGILFGNSRLRCRECNKSGGVLAANGKIYGIPGASTTVLEIDPETNTATTFGTLSGGWVGGVLAPNGKIYGIPNYNAPVLVIDPKSNATLDINVLLSGYFNKY